MDATVFVSSNFEPFVALKFIYSKIYCPVALTYLVISLSQTNLYANFDVMIYFAFREMSKEMTAIKTRCQVSQRVMR